MSDEANNIPIQASNTPNEPLEVHHVETEPTPEVEPTPETPTAVKKKPKWHYAAAIICAGAAGAGLYYNGTRETGSEVAQVRVVTPKENAPWITPSDEGKKYKSEEGSPTPIVEPVKPAETPPDWRPGPVTPEPPKPVTDDPKPGQTPVVINPEPAPKTDAPVVTTPVDPPKPVTPKPVVKKKVDEPFCPPVMDIFRAIDEFFAEFFGVEIVEEEKVPSKPMSKKKQ